MIRFCSSGTVAAPISTPRSPRATITASASASTSSSASTASAFSIFAITRAGEPCWRMIACRSRTSAAARTNESATKSTPSASANSRSSRSFFVSDGIGIGTPGRFTPLCDFTSPPTTTRQRARPPSTVLDARGGRARRRSGCRGPAAAPRRSRPGAIGSSPSMAALLADDVDLLVLQRARAAPAGRRCGASAPAGRRSARAACRSPPAPRARPRRARRDPACVPCEKLSRTASTPASTSSRSESWVDEAGPMVATIFVLRRSTATFPD